MAVNSEYLCIMKTGDCFIMMGSNKEEPMTVYLIKEMTAGKLYALTVCVKKVWIHGWDWPEEFDNDIPEDAVMVPAETYSYVKRQMTDYCTWAHEYICSNIIKTGIGIEIGKHYYSRSIGTVTKVEDGKVFYNCFKIGSEDITPYGTGRVRIDSVNIWPIVPDEVYEEVKSRYQRLVLHLQEYLFATAMQCRGK